MPNGWRTIKSQNSTSRSTRERNGWILLARKVKACTAERRWMRNPVWPSSCVTPAGTSNELDVQNEWEENTHTHTHTRINRVRLPILLVVSRTGKMNISLSPFAPENMVSRNGFANPVPRQPAHLHTQAESGAYLRDSSRVPRRRPFIYLNRHTPSGQSRVYRVTQLRTDGAESPPAQGQKTSR